jgi:hypothetical protein
MPGVRYSRGECVLLPAFLVLYRKFETDAAAFCMHVSISPTAERFFCLSEQFSATKRAGHADKSPLCYADAYERSKMSAAFLTLARPAKRLCLV